MTEMFGEAWSPMSVPDLAPDDDDDDDDVHMCTVLFRLKCIKIEKKIYKHASSKRAQTIRWLM